MDLSDNVQFFFIKRRVEKLSLLCDELECLSNLGEQEEFKIMDALIRIEKDLVTLEHISERRKERVESQI